MRKASTPVVSQDNRKSETALGSRYFSAEDNAAYVCDAARWRDVPGVRRAGGLLLPFLVTACNHAPQQDLLGSFFPAWMLCAALGFLVSIILRVVLGAAGINAHVPVPPLTYICCAALVTMLVWLGWFGQ